MSSVAFGYPWAALGAGAPFVTFGGPMGRLLGVSGLHLSPWGVHWMPLGVIGDHLWRHFWSLLIPLKFVWRRFVTFLTFCAIESFGLKKKHSQKSKVWERIGICGSRRTTLKNSFFSPPKRNIALARIFVGLNALHINLFTRLLWRNPIFYYNKRVRKTWILK